MLAARLIKTQRRLTGPLLASCGATDGRGRANLLKCAAGQRAHAQRDSSGREMDQKSELNVRLNT